LIVFCFASWILLLVPVLNLFPITTLMNDRYLYLPMVPFFCGVLLGVNELLKAIQVKRLTEVFHAANFQVASIIVFVSMFCWGTLSYLPVWSQPLTLWHHAQEETPSLTVVQIQWAITLKELGEVDAAAQALHFALDHCHPDEFDQKRIQTKLDEWASEKFDGA